jgi:hypothetical protein
MKSFIYVTLLLIALSFCDNCSSKPENECTGTCEWTAGTAATCVKKTDCAHTGTAPNVVCSDTTNCVANGEGSACESKAATCEVNVAGTACASDVGCVFTAATQDSCTELSSDPDSDSDSDSDTTKSSAFGLKTSFLLIFLYFFF